jgi:hypothetical protein
MKTKGKTIFFKSNREYKKFTGLEQKKENTPQEKRLARIEKKLRELETRMDNTWLEVFKLKRSEK